MNILIGNSAPPACLLEDIAVIELSAPQKNAAEKYDFFFFSPHHGGQVFEF